MAATESDLFNTGDGTLGNLDAEDTDGCWVQCITWDEEKEADTVRRLVQQKLLVANTQVFKDMNNDKDWKTLSLEPLQLSDVNVPAMANASKLCTSFNVDFKPQISSSGVSEIRGSAKLVFRKRLDLEKCLPMMKALTSGISIQHIEDQATLYPTGEKKSNTKEYFKMKAALTEHRFEIRNDTSTLFTNNITETTTEEELYDLFPLADSVIISKQPFCHAYIQFGSEEKQREMVEILKKQLPPKNFPKLYMTALCNARRAFGINRFNMAQEKKQEKLEVKQANMLRHQQGKRAAVGNPNLGNPNVGNPPAVSNAPQQQPGLGQLTATLGQLATALGSQRGASPGAPQGVGVPGQGAPGAEGVLSKGQMRRRKMQKKKADARELEASQGGDMMQNPNQMMQGTGQMQHNQMNQGQMNQGHMNQGQMNPAPNMNNGLNLVIQTLSTLAQTMSGGQSIGIPMSDQIGPNSQGPAKKRAKKRRQNNSLSMASSDDTLQQPQANDQQVKAGATKPHTSPSPQPQAKRNKNNKPKPPVKPAPPSATVYDGCMFDNANQNRAAIQQNNSIAKNKDKTSQGKTKPQKGFKKSQYGKPRPGNQPRKNFQSPYKSYNRNMSPNQVSQAWYDSSSYGNSTWNASRSDSYGNKSIPYGTGSTSYGSGSGSLGTGSGSYGTGSSSYGTGSSSYGTGSSSYGNNSSSHGNGSYGHMSSSYEPESKSYNSHSGQSSNYGSLINDQSRRLMNLASNSAASFGSSSYGGF